MDFQFLAMIFKLLLVLPFILILLYISLKFGGEKFQKLQNTRFIKILEKVNISKENSIMIVKIGNEGYVISSTHSEMNVLKELTKEQTEKIEKDKKNQKLEFDKNLLAIGEKLKLKKVKKEDIYEKKK